MSRIQLHDIRKSYAGVPVLPSVSVHVDSGEVLGLLGPTGCGKTTLLRIVAGITLPDAGTLHINNELANAPALIIPPTRRGVGMVFQDLALWPHMSARRHLEYTLSATCRDRAARRTVAENLLARVHLTEHAAKRPAAMSRGQRQRLAIARALCNDPAVLLLDEPASSQDEVMAQTMLDLFHQCKTEGTAIIVAAHDKSFLKSLSDRMLVFENNAVRCVDAHAID